MLALALLPTLAAAPANTEVWVELPTPADHARARAAGFGWAEGQDGDWFRLDGTPAMADAAGLRWRAPRRLADGWIPSPADIAARLDALGAGAVVQIGESALGEPLLAVRLGAGARALRVLAGHHGDEGASVEVALRLAEAVAAGDIALPPDTELWVVPAVNPDGLAAATRVNAGGVDLNRNYGVAWSADTRNAGVAPFSEPETRAVRALARARSFDAGLSLHAGAQNIGWVWNYSVDERPVEEPLLAALADVYAARCDAPGFWTTNGADWYETTGDTTDWAYGAWGAYDFTLELTTEKAPPAAQIDTYVAWHLDALAAWLTRPPDVTATVRDALTGEPLPARVDGDGVAPLWTGPDGVLARWTDGDADPAAWIVDAPGYTPAPLTADTRLQPAALLPTLPTPRLLSRGAGPTPVTLPGAGAGPLTLVQPGESPVTVDADAPGTWTVDPDALAPGAWTLVTDGGVVPRALFVGEVDDRVLLTRATLAGGLLTLEGAGFAPGAEAWSIGGPARAWHALQRLSEADDALVFRLDGADEDVVVWVNGAWLSVVDVQGSPTVDPTPPPMVTPDDTDALDPTLDAVGRCATATPGSSLVLAVVGLALASRRRGSFGRC